MHSCTSFRRLTFISIIVLLLSCQSFGQSAPKRLLGSFIVDKKAYNYEFTMDAIDSYSLLISTISDDDSGDDKDKKDTSEYVFNEFTKEIFQRVFSDQMNVKFSKSGISVDNAASEVFFKIKARLDFIDDEPVTAYVIMKKDYIWSMLSNNSSNYYQGRLSRLLVQHYIHRVEAETEDGTLKNISVYLIEPPDTARSPKISPRRFLLFKNQFPISISGKFDYEKFSGINLYCYNCNGIDGLSRYIRLSDLAILDIVYENDKEDYSPSNRTFSLTPSAPITELKKEKRSKILEVAAFTDFIGLDRDEPNGLIQLEIKRRININTKHRLLVRRKKNIELLSQIDLGEVNVDPNPEKKDKGTEYKITSKDNKTTNTIVVPNTKFRSPYFNFFSYIEPKLLFSKLEENNRLLDSAEAPNKIVDPVSLYQHQVASFGLNLQVLRFSFPQIKLQWNFLNTGVYWSRTKVATSSDSTGPSVGLNVNNWEFGTNFTFRPDNRWGASLGMAYILPAIWNSEYELTTKDGMFQHQFDAWLRTGTDGKLFFRFRRTYENKDRNNNFTQIQLGYSQNLFAGTNTTTQKGK